LSLYKYSDVAKIFRVKKLENKSNKWLSNALETLKGELERRTKEYEEYPEKINDEVESIIKENASTLSALADYTEHKRNALLRWLYYYMSRGNAVERTILRHRINPLRRAGKTDEIIDLLSKMRRWNRRPSENVSRYVRDILLENRYRIRWKRFSEVMRREAEEFTPLTSENIRETLIRLIRTKSGEERSIRGSTNILASILPERYPTWGPRFDEYRKQILKNVRRLRELLKNYVKLEKFISKIRDKIEEIEKIMVTLFDIVRTGVSFYYVLTGRKGYPSGAFQSLDFNEPIIYRENGKIKIEKIGELVDRFFNNDEEVGVKYVNGIEVPSVDLKTLKISWTPIRYVFRHHAPEHLYRFRLQTGREITVTGSHSLYTLTADGIRVVKASELKVGNFLVIPKQLPYPKGRKVKKINILDFIDETILNKKMYLRKVPKEVFSRSKKEIISWARTHYSTKRPRKVFERWRKKGILRLELKNLLTEKELDKVRVGYESYHRDIPVIINVDEKLGRLLGYYIAEGGIYEDRRISFAINKNENDIYGDIKKDVHDLFSEVISVKDFDNGSEGRSLDMNNALLARLFKKMGITTGAKNKRVPEIILNAEPSVQRSFLISYSKGDKGCTASKYLVSDLCYLLLFHGIVAAYSHSSFNGSRWYKIFNPDADVLSKGLIIPRKRTYWDSIPLIFIENFVKKTGFFVKRTRRGLSAKEFKRNHRFDINVLKMLYDKQIMKIKEISKSIQKDERVTKIILYSLKRKDLCDYNREEAWISNKGKRIMPLIQTLEKLYNSDLAFVKIREIKKVKPTGKFVYDVSVPKNENFIAGFGGVLCHNSSFVIDAMYSPETGIVYTHPLTLKELEACKKFFIHSWMGANKIFGEDVESTDVEGFKVPRGVTFGKDNTAEEVDRPVGAVCVNIRRMNLELWQEDWGFRTVPEIDIIKRGLASEAAGEPLSEEILNERAILERGQRTLDEFIGEYKNRREYELERELAVGGIEMVNEFGRWRIRSSWEGRRGRQFGVWGKLPPEELEKLGLTFEIVSSGALIYKPTPEEERKMISDRKKRIGEW